MIITIPWLKKHLNTKASETKIIDQLTNLGLEVEGIKDNLGELGEFKVAKILKTEKHPNADKLKICDVSLGDKKISTHGADFWIAPNAAVIGSVVLKKNASIWFSATLRGDNDPIIVGENSNIQDGSVCHTDDGMPLTIGDDVTIGHKVILHSCTVGNNSLIGMGSTVLNLSLIHI